MVECSFMNYVVVGSSSVGVTWILEFSPALSKAFLGIRTYSYSSLVLIEKLKNITDKEVISAADLSKYFECLLHKLLTDKLLSCTFNRKQKAKNNYNFSSQEKAIFGFAAGTCSKTVIFSAQNISIY